MGHTKECDRLLKGGVICACDQGSLIGCLSNSQGCGTCYTPELGERGLQGCGRVHVMISIMGTVLPHQILAYGDARDYY